MTYEKIKEIAVAHGIDARIADDLIRDESARVDNQPQGDLLQPKNASGERLKQYIERIERLNEEKAALSDDIKDIFADAKGTGFDTVVVRRIIILRKMDRQKRIEQEELLDLYKSSIGMD